jgi:hypothetical protein
MKAYRMDATECRTRDGHGRIFILKGMRDGHAAFAIGDDRALRPAR